MHMLKTYNSL